MLFNREITEWEHIVNGSYDIEFDYVAIDRIGQLAIFSTFNRGFKPKIVTKSFEDFLKLDKFIETLPKIGTPIQKVDNDGNYDDWRNYAELGFYAYDNQDVHRTNKLERYDIIYQPKEPLTIENQTELKKFENIIPKFDLVFGENLKFVELENTLKE
ncbi:MULTISPECIES: hypothetical protein [Flavobacterium]|jgi:hypothetical protein|uniref:Uncharacterized protein n=1 Tax=Flavobacterium hydrophilum TaxID=2211445 RepID=A0A2V4C420_9FLAO|nr:MULTISPECIES: hypothetical protein [Flavobacterium]PXY46091.1 hypothetical protein DMB68_02570 [Flavobacterium hydrophilum]